MVVVHLTIKIMLPPVHNRDGMGVVRCADGDGVDLTVDGVEHLAKILELFRLRKLTQLSAT